MSVISVFSGIFCKGDHVVRLLQTNTGYKLVADKDIVAEASRLSGMAESKVERAFSAKISVFNKFTHEKERSIAHLRLALAQMLSGDGLLINGFAGLLIPKEVGHVLRICLIANRKFRDATAKEEQGVFGKDGIKLSRQHDEDCASWVETLFNKNDPWDPRPR